ncbi:Mitochondrial 2-oxoglutarate/malate carrier protein [Operophtera brumata]|uniref:Mitochondrial 2-oxoglutarate/malate carrier protein n=1 Tax=Operophtera brumata TaxID=104452 RepID=A0A0L7LCW8_OPEBR|nr:Mitochondrial 2-oxoglutarate/malate carrier protein [Operophtera brumata]
MMMAMVTHPLDLVKVRMQVFPSASSTVDMATRIARCEGFSALYSGLSAGLMRQATYTTTRLGVYLWMYEQYRNVYGVVPPLPDKMLMGAYAAMAGAFAGNPSEVILVRMMADGRRDPCGAVCGPKRHYRGLYDAVYK